MTVRTGRQREGQTVKRLYASTLSANLLIIAFGTLGSILTARTLGPSDRGVLVALLVWSGTIGQLSLLGLDDATTWWSQGRFSAARVAALALRRRVLVQGLVGATLVGAVGLLMTHSFTTARLVTVALISGGTLLSVATMLLLAPARLRQDTRAWNCIRILPTATLSIICLMMAIFDFLTLLGAAFGFAFGNLLAFLSAARTVKVDPEQFETDAKTELSVVKRYGFRLLLSTIPNVITQRMDQLFLAAVATSSTLAIYAVAASIVSLVLVVAVTIEQVAFPMFSRNPPRRRRLILATFALVCTGLCVTAVFDAIAPQLVDLMYGEDYVGAVMPMMWLFIGATFRIAASPLMSANKASGGARVLWQAQWTSLVFTLASLVPLFIALGSEGVAISVVLGQASLYLFLLFAYLYARPSSGEPQEMGSEEC